jgi:hypothetical protein
MPARKSGCG